MSEQDDHQSKLLAAFADVLRAEDSLSAAKTLQDEAVAYHARAVNGDLTRLEQAWEKVRLLMTETGEYEVLLPGSVTDYKISFSTPRESVKVVDPSAVPDEFCKLERKPRLKEIGEHLKGLRSSGSQLPNWAGFELGPRKLGWKAVKRSHTTT